jgi:hypothetical protein
LLKSIFLNLESKKEYLEKITGQVKGYGLFNVFLSQVPLHMELPPAAQLTAVFQVNQAACCKKNCTRSVKNCTLLAATKLFILVTYCNLAPLRTLYPPRGNNMKKISALLSIFLFTGVFSAFAVADVQFMSKEILKEKLDSESITILDTRSERGWSSSESKIPGGIRAAGNEIEHWSAELQKDQILVLYCS